MPPVRLAILTNGPGPRQQRRLRNRGLQEHIPTWVISGEVGARKPDPAFFHTAIRELEVQPGEAVMIGDALAIDIRGAKSVGMKTIWLNRRGVREVPPCEEMPDAEAHTLLEAVDIMEHWR